MRKKPTNLTLSDPIRQRASQLMVMQGFTSFSAFVEQLIRMEYSRQFTTTTNAAPAFLSESGAINSAPPPAPVVAALGATMASAGRAAKLYAAPAPPPKPARKRKLKPAPGSTSPAS